MRTLRSGKSLPESSLKKRRSVGASETPPPQSHGMPHPRRASISAISQEKEPLKLIITRRMSSRSQDESQVSAVISSRRDRSSGSSVHEKSDVSDTTGGGRKDRNHDPDASTSFAAVAEKMIKKMSPVKEDFQETNGSPEMDDPEKNKDSEEVKHGLLSNGAAEVKKSDGEDADEPSTSDDPPKRTPRKRREPTIFDSSSTERLAKNEICEVCGLGFTRKAALLRHSQSHLMEVPEPAPVVKKRSIKPIPSPSVSTTSDTPGIINCDVCGILFTRKAHLDRHMKLHTGERPFECDVCSLKFTRKDHMVSHRVKHSQPEKEQSCHYCKASFSSLNLLRDHVEAEHLTDETTTDQHICEICGKQFLQRRYLQAHRKLHRLRGETAAMGHPLLADIDMDEDEVNFESGDAEMQDSVGETSHATRKSASQLNSSSHGHKPAVMINRMVKLSADLALKSRTQGGEGRKSSTEDEIELRYESPLKRLTPSPARGQRRHECQVCGLCVSSIIELRKHYKIHKKRYICRFCGMRLASAGSLMRHNLLHTGKKEFGCDLCGKKFSRKDTLAVHVQQHSNKSPVRVNLAKPFLCKICGARYAEKFKLIRHLKITHSCAANTSNSAYRPTTSNFTTAYAEFDLDGQTDDPNETSLGYNAASEESEQIKTEPVDYREDEGDEQNWESFETPLEESTLNPNEDEGNASDGNADKNYQCDHCDKIFKNSKSLNTHKWYLAREKLFTCPICKRGFKYSTDLNRHITTHSNPSSKSSLMGKQRGVSVSVPMRPRPPLLLQGHQRLPIAMPRGGINALEDRPFGCSICPQRFNHRSNLSRHMRLIHNGSVALRKRVPNSINLQNYLKKLNTQEPQKVSMINQNCLQMFKSQPKGTAVAEFNEDQWKDCEEEVGEEPVAANGQEVMDRAAAIAEAQRPARGSVDHSLPDGSFTYEHNSSRPYVCNPCGKSFENRSSLWTHMRIHNKSFACNFCGLKTATHGDLVLHLRTHTGERPYKCSRCEWRFSRKSALNKHFRKYHSATSGRVLRPWVYREDRGNLKFKFVRSSPQRNDFEMRHLRGQHNLSTNKIISRPLPKLTPNPNQIRASGSGTILKSALQTQHQHQRESKAEHNSSMSAVFKCRKCGTVIHGKNNYIEHVKSHSSMSITAVNTGTLNRSSGRRSGQESQQDSFKCNICGKSCSTIGFLSRHYQYVHPNEHNPAEEARFKTHDQAEEDEERDPLVPEVIMDTNNDEDDDGDDFGDPNIPPNTRPNYTVPLDEKDRILNRYNIVVEEDDDQDLSDSTPFPYPYNLAREGLEILQVIPPCPRCGKEFTNKKSRSDHVWYCNRKRMYLCPVLECRKGFKLKHDISRHIRRHMDDKRFSCQACPLKFHRKMELHRHLSSTHDINMFSFDYPCDFCDMEFKDETIYVTHLELAHSMDRNDLVGCGLDISQGNSDFGFGNDGDYEQDDEDFDGTPDPTVFLEQSMQAVDEKTFECIPCKKVFPDRQKYMFHRYYHEREPKYPCPNCDERFKLRSHLERHIMTYHNALKPIDRIFKCEKCPRKFTREHDLVTHFNREHSNGNPMTMLRKTPVNPTKNLSPKKLQPAPSTSQEAHRLSPSQVAEKFNQLIEEGSKNSESPDKSKNDGFLTSRKSATKTVGIEMGQDGMYHCDLCPKVFEEKKVADAHRYYHQREHKYSCDHCGAKFKQNSDLQRHNRIHHNPANRKRTMHCQQCLRSFTDKRYLRMHLKRYHSDQQGNGGDSSRKGIPPGSLRRPGGKPATTASTHALNMAKLRMRNTRAYTSSNVTKEESKPESKQEKVQQKSPPLETKEEAKITESPETYDADYTIEAIEVEDDDESAMVLDSWGLETQSSHHYDEDEEEITAIEEQEYMRHEMNSTGESSEVDPLAGTEDESFEIQCQVCDGLFNSEAELDAHECCDDSLLEQNNDMNVPILSRRSMRGNAGAVGRQPVSGARPFFCEDCGKPFTQRVELNAHLQAMHGKAMEEYDCPFCPKSFLVKKSLDSHKRRHHGNIIQFHHCDQCGRQFTSQKFLESHLKTCASN